MIMLNSIGLAMLELAFNMVVTPANVKCSFTPSSQFQGVVRESTLDLGVVSSSTIPGPTARI